MKKIGTALIVADMLLCLVLIGYYSYSRSHEWERAAFSDAAGESTPERQQEQEIRRVAITFDDEDIIGYSLPAPNKFDLQVFNYFTTGYKVLLLY